MFQRASVRGTLRRRDFACAGFTLSKANGFCWLKNSSYTRKQQNRSKGAISGLMGS